MKKFSDFISESLNTHHPLKMAFRQGKRDTDKFYGNTRDQSSRAKSVSGVKPKNQFKPANDSERAYKAGVDHANSNLSRNITRGNNGQHDSLALSHRQQYNKSYKGYTANHGTKYAFSTLKKNRLPESVEQIDEAFLGGRKLKGKPNPNPMKAHSQAHIDKVRRAGRDTVDNADHEYHDVRRDYERGVNYTKRELNSTEKWANRRIARGDHMMAAADHAQKHTLGTSGSFKVGKK